MSASAPVALITGANKGIGLALVDHLVKARRSVYLGSRDTARGEAARNSLSNANNVHVLPLDITDSAVRHRATSTCSTKFARS